MRCLGVASTGSMTVRTRPSTCRQICTPAILCLARGVEVVAGGRAPAVPTQDVQDALGSLFALLQREVNRAGYLA